MTKIRENLWLGDAEDAIAPVGITAIVNVAYDVDRSHDPVGIKAVKISLDDGPNNPQILKDMAVDAVVWFMRAGETVLVHCQHGRGRSAWVVAQAIATTEQKSFEDAYSELLGLREVRKFNLLHPAHCKVANLAAEKCGFNRLDP